MNYRQNIERCESMIFDAVGMTENVDYRIIDVNMIGNVAGSIHTIEAGPIYAQTLVLIHGYGSGAVNWYKMIDNLRSIFHVYAIDLYGMGLSTRSDMLQYDPEQLAELYAESLEGWRRALNLGDFVLMSHSLGAYITSHWIRLKNPPIKMLYLLSPAGFTNKDMKEEKANESLSAKLYRKGYEYFINKKQRNPYLGLPFNEQRFTNQFIELNGLSVDHAKILGKRYHQILKLGSLDEIVVSKFLYYAKYSQYPICDILDEVRRTRGLTYPIRVIYGANDTMDYEETVKMISRLDLRIPVDFIHNAEHRVLLQNPDDVVTLMTIDYKRGYDKIRHEFIISQCKPHITK